MTTEAVKLYSSMRFEGDGVTTVVALTFDLRKDDRLTVDFGEGIVEGGYVVDFDSQPVLVIFDEPLPKDKTITIRRRTDIDRVPYVFQVTGNAQGGSPFNAFTIDTNFDLIVRASQDAMDSQVLASETLEEMAGIRDDANKYRNEAEGFRNEAEVLRDSTIVKADEASVSAGKAKTSEVNAKTSETNSKESETDASASASSALASATTAMQEATKAGTYASNAKTSETNSKTSETNSKTSETNANSSASKAKTSETNAKASETNSKTSETNASNSASRAKDSENLAKKWATNPVDDEVEEGKYSAMHWAVKAKESVGFDIEEYRKLDDNVFNGYLQVRSEHEGQGTGVFLQDTDGTVRGQVVATDQGLQLTQYPEAGGVQTFTFPSEGGEIATTSYVDDKINGISDSTPIGTVQAYIGENAPNAKWLLCRGQAFSAESYPDLAQLLPDLKIPDLRGVALRGLDANRGFDPGRELLSYQEDAMQKIEGSFQKGGVPENTVSGVFVGGGVMSGYYGAVASYYGSIIKFDSSIVTRTNSQNETVMKNVAVNFIIKAR